jgi:hypothetical protein
MESKEKRGLFLRSENFPARLAKGRIFLIITNKDILSL